METKDAYKQKMEASLNEWGAQINLLAAKAQSAGANAKLTYAKDLDLLRRKQREAAKKIKQLEAAGGDEWITLKESTDTLWNDLKDGVTNTAAKFK